MELKDFVAFHGTSASFRGLWRVTGGLWFQKFKAMSLGGSSEISEVISEHGQAFLEAPLCFIEASERVVGACSQEYFRGFWRVSMKIEDSFRGVWGIQGFRGCHKGVY